MNRPEPKSQGEVPNTLTTALQAEGPMTQEDLNDLQFYCHLLSGIGVSGNSPMARFFRCMKKCSLLTLITSCSTLVVAKLAAIELHRLHFPHLPEPQRAAHILVLGGTRERQLLRQILKGANH